MTTITFDEVTKHPGSSGHGAVLFMYKGRLFRAPHGYLLGRCEELIDAPVPIQKLIPTEYILKHPRHGNLKVFEHKIYDHLVRINESIPYRAIEYVKTACLINKYLLSRGYVLSDVHEGNVYDTIDGIVWTDWGSIFSLNKKEGRTRPAATGLAMTLYLANKYIYGLINCQHTDYSLSKAKKTSGPLQEIAYKSASSVSTWQQIIDIVDGAKIPPMPKSHWADDYAAGVSPENIIKTSRKGEPVASLLDSITYDTLTDVACNKGYFTLYAARHCRSAVGLDIDGKCIHTAIKNKPPNIPVIFSKKDIKTIIKNSKLEKIRYSSELVLALAIVHHVKKIMPHANFANCLADLSKKHIIIEDVDSAPVYEKIFLKRGFKLINRLTSYPKSRTISLYSK
jgi:hypothetical protein